MKSLSFTKRTAFFMLVNAVSLLAARGLTDVEIKSIQDDFPKRCESAINSRKLDDFKPRKIEDPLGPNRPPYARGFGYSVASYALTAFWRGQHVKEANAALCELIRYFTLHREVRNDYDNFYWWTPLLVRAVEFFGRDGTRVKGRMEAEVEDAALELMWLWAKEYSSIEETSLHPDFWRVRDSENHHVQGFSACWDFSRLLSRRADYRERRFDDGHTIAEHYAAWTEYAKNSLAKRAKQGFFIEAATEYNLETMKGIYQFRDFAEDPELRRRADIFITLFWRRRAQEQIDGVRGGGNEGLSRPWSTKGQDGTRRLGWFYFGIGSPDSAPQIDELVFLTSGYRQPDLVVDSGSGCAGSR